MELTREQTNKVLKKLCDYQIGVFDMEDVPSGLINLPELQDEYFNEKVNEALEETDDVKIEDVQKLVDYLWEDEERNYEESEKPEGHIFEVLQKLQKAISNQVAKEV